jgi:translation initiation factor IF-1
MAQPVIQQPAPANPQPFQRLKEGQFAISGQVLECLPNTMFQVEVSDSDVTQLIGQKLLCTLAGKMRLHRIRVMPGDKVVGYVTKYDLTHGKITFRVK